MSVDVIYVIQGTTGEYSDRDDWLVCAYRSRELAEEHARKAMLRAKEIRGEGVFTYDVPIGANQYDFNMRMDYTGTEYTVIEVEIQD